MAKRGEKEAGGKRRCEEAGSGKKKGGRVYKRLGSTLSLNERGKEKKRSIRLWGSWEKGQEEKSQNYWIRLSGGKGETQRGKKKEEKKETPPRKIGNRREEPISVRKRTRMRAGRDGRLSRSEIPGSGDSRPGGKRGSDAEERERETEENDLH